jgi:threonine aldolase
MQGIIDLRSDTITKPSAAMLEAMWNAPVGDDVYGEDPTVNELEAYVADLMGFESAMFTPSGTMANQIAIHCHTRHGDGILTEEDSHVFLYEAGAAAAQSGVQFELIPLSASWSAAAMESKIKPDWLHYASTRLIVVENTHNRGSGRVLDLATLARIKNHAKHHKLSLHCDGARIWNAAKALNCRERDLTEGFDSVSVCFSKGLGAPVGSALLGQRRFIERARKVRKRWGGGMRQAGYLAAGALFALKNNRNRLDMDHQHIKTLHNGIMSLAQEGLPIQTSLPEIWTNILYFTAKNADFLVKSLQNDGVLVSHMGQGKIRAVTHLHIEDSDIERTILALRRALKNK